MPAQDEYVVQILHDVGLVTNDDILKARELTKHGGVSLLEGLLKGGRLTEVDVSKALAGQFGMDFIQLAEYRVSDEVIAMVPRHVALRYRGFDLDGTEIDRSVDGFHARVVQHECDHLDGVLYPMRIEDMRQFGYTEVLFPQLAADGDDD